MYQQRRTTYLSQVKSNSLSIFFSGHAPQKSNDQYYPFTVNRNFFYLTGIDQENVCLLLIKGKEESASYLFIAKNDPVKVLWDGAGLSFEEASVISELEFKDIVEINQLDHSIYNFLSTTRSALFGNLDTFYLDLERPSEISADTKAILYAHQLRTLYPFLNIISNQMILAEQRMVKDAFEIELTRKAIDITEKGLNRVMKKLKPGLYEYQVEAEYNFVLNQHRVIPAFGTIAASGKNATVLHYVENKDEIKDGTLVLFDLGVNYGNYCSDITRVFPANGKFTERQKAVYQVVLDVNKKSILWLKPGVTVGEFKEYGKSLLIEGAKKLGLIKEDHEIINYYYHGLGHYLGLDVHDVGNYSTVIPEGALITVEPGLYIAQENIGIRIEDDVYVTKEGPINLSESIIKEIQEIEDCMKK